MFTSYAKFRDEQDGCKVNGASVSQMTKSANLLIPVHANSG